MTEQMTAREQEFLEGLVAVPGLFKQNEAAIARRLRDAGLVECEVFNREAGIWMGRATQAGRDAILGAPEKGEECC